MMNRLVLFLVCGIAVAVAGARQGEIRPGELWRDTAGHVINAHGGGVMFDRGVYWWYGEHSGFPRVSPKRYTGQFRGFKARSVVGGVFIPVLRHLELVKKYRK